MKTSVLAFLFLLCSQILSQFDRQDKINQRDFIKERNPHKTNSLKQNKSPFVANSFQDNESRRGVNKTALNDEFLLTEQIEQFWDNTGWVNKRIFWFNAQIPSGGGKHIYQYNVNNNIIEDLWQDWRDSKWESAWKNNYTYNENNNLIEDLFQHWSNSGYSWESAWKNNYTYDTNNNIIEDLQYNWIGSIWKNGWKYTYTYDTANNRIEEKLQSWYDSHWENETKNTYNYDTNKNMIEDLRQGWHNSSWENNYKHTYKYDENNNLIEDACHFWNDSSWGNPTTHTYIYDENNNLIEDLWVELNNKHTYKYDENNNLIEEQWQDWFNGFDFLITYTYDANNNLIEELNQIWIDSNWVNNLRTIYTYQAITKIEQFTEVIESYSLSNNYPNPFNPTTTISWQSPVGSWQTLKVYDLLGNEIATLVNEYKPAGTYEINWNAANLPSGVYFYQLSAEGFVQTNKMILIK